MNPNLRKLIAISLCVSTFATQVAFASAAESNFWAERRRSVSAQESNRQPTQLASLPASLNPNLNSNNLLKQLPSIGGNLPLAPKWSDSNKKGTVGLSKEFRNLIDSIPLMYGSIQDVYDSGSNQAPPVVLVQDVHMNTEAQTNIASILQELIDQKQVGLVGVEGAFTRFDFKPFRIFPNKEITRAVAEDFLKKNLMAAPSLVGITSPTEPPEFMGVDDKEHYDANLEALYASRDQKARVLQEVDRIKKNLIDEKRKIFSKELNDFDNLRAAYHKGDVGFGVYVKKLALDRPGTDFVVQQFLEAYAMESTMDFQRVESERRMVIEKLTKTLDEKEISNLVAQSLAYRMGRMGFGPYYQGIRALCSQKGIHLTQTPHFENYIRYVLLSDGIKANSLFKSVDKLEQEVVAGLAKTPEERRLSSLSEQVSLIDKLLDFSLTPDEWEKYKTLVHSPWTIDHRPNISPFEKFYEQADIRSHKMLEKLSTTPSTGPKALVLGGFHSPQVAQLLRQSKISYVVVSPKLTKIDGLSGSAYLSAFAREKTPLDRLFAGEKLFLASAGVAIGARGAASGSEALALGVMRYEQEGATEPREIKVGSKTYKLFHNLVKGVGVVFHETRVVLSHPITAVFTETAFLALINGLGLPVSNGFSSILLNLGVTGVIAAIFSFGHQWMRKEYSTGAFWQRFLAIGILLVAPIVYMPGWPGVYLSGFLHLLWNVVYYLRGSILHSRVGKNRFLKSLLTNILSLSALNQSVPSSAGEWDNFLRSITGKLVKGGYFDEAKKGSLQETLLMLIGSNENGKTIGELINVVCSHYRLNANAMSANFLPDELNMPATDRILRERAMIMAPNLKKIPPVGAQTVVPTTSQQSTPRTVPTISDQRKSLPKSYVQFTPRYLGKPLSADDPEIGTDRYRF